MKKLMFVLALCLFITSYSMAGPGDEITGVSIDDYSSVHNSTVDPIGTINEDGFIVANYTHNGTFADFWVGNVGTAVVDQHVTYDLGAEYEIGKIDIWNYNGGSLGRCVKDVNVAVSTDGTNFTVVESIIVPQGVASGEEPVHTFYVNPRATARYVMIDVQSNYGDGYVGFAEIKFFEYVPGEITGVVINDSSGSYNSTCAPVNTVNESGFDSGTYTHDAVFTNLWCSNGGTVADEYITYDLGGSYDVGKIDIWNYCGSTGRSTKVVDVNVSPDGVNWTVAETLTLAVGQASAPEPAQTFFVDPNVVVRYVQIDVKEGYGGVTNYVGFAEIKFFEYVDNAAPTVSAGPHQEIILPADATMAADVNDADGDTLTLLWTKVSGPNDVTFDTNDIEDPTVSFDGPGYYQLQLSADDGVNSAVTSTLYVRVMPAGWSYIDGVEAIEQSTYIAGREMGKTVDESGLNAGVLGSHSGGSSYGDNWHSANPATVDDQYLIWDLGGLYDVNGIRVWTCNALIAMGVKDCNMLVSTDDSTYTDIGAFSFAQAPGNADTDYSEVSMVTPVFCRYVKMDINTNWGQTNFTGLSEIKFSGTLANAAPVVDAGQGAEVIYPADADITDATASDPDSDAITILWTKVSGPNDVTFDANDVIDPTVSFDGPGAYVLQLTVTDSYNQVATDTIPVRVLPTGWNTIAGVTGERQSSYVNINRMIVKTIDESGLNVNGLGTHSTEYDDNWHSVSTGVVDDQYLVWDLGDNYLVNGLRVWTCSNITTMGVKDCNMLVSTDDSTYTDIGAFSFAQAPGNDTTDYSEVSMITPVMCRYIKMDINTNWTRPTFTGLAEIKFSGNLNGCSSQMAGDLDDDCEVDLDDLGMMAGQWLNSIDPTVGGSGTPWTSDGPTMLHRWSFDTDGTDSVGTANATLKGGAAITSGQLVLAQNFADASKPGDPTDSGVSWAEISASDANDTFATLTDITVEAWFTANTLNLGDYADVDSIGVQRVFQFAHEGQIGLNPFRDAETMSWTDINRTEGVFSAPSASGSIGSTIEPEATLDTEHHVVYTYSPGELTLYLDGELAAYASGDASDVSDVLVSQAYFGRYYMSDDDAPGQTISYSDFFGCFDGKINEVRIYDGAMSAVKVAANYSLGANSLAPTTCQEALDAGYSPTYAMKLDGDCTLNLDDFAAMAADWLEDTGL